MTCHCQFGSCHGLGADLIFPDRINENFYFFYLGTDASIGPGLGELSGVRSRTKPTFQLVVNLQGSGCGRQ